jgi:hypothetical protein
MNEVITKSEAKAKGLNRFFTGVPCKRGHTSERIVSTGVCTSCRKEDGLKSSVKYNTKNKAKITLKNKEYRKTNKDEIAKRRKELRASNPCVSALHNKNTRIKTRNERPWVLMLQSVRSRAKSKNIEYDLDNAWAESIWTGRCSITGINFDMSGGRKGPKARSPSIDRIIPDFGYTKGNCRIVLHCVNALKNDATDNETEEVVVELHKYFSDKANARSVVFLEVNEAFTTQTCSCCGTKAGPKGLSGLNDRVWQCVECSVIHDRDINSALNILALGQQSLAGGIPAL